MLRVKTLKRAGGVGPFVSCSFSAALALLLVSTVGFSAASQNPLYNSLPGRISIAGSEAAGHAGATGPSSGGGPESPCGAFASQYGSANESEELPYYQNYSLMFSELCVTPAFVALYNGLGPDGFFGIGEIGQSSGMPTLDFALYWTGDCTNASLGGPSSQCTFSAVWTGNLSNNSLSGPFAREYPLVNAGGSAVTTASRSSAGWATWLAPTVSLMAAGIVGGIALSVVVRRRRLVREQVLRDDGRADPTLSPTLSEADLERRSGDARTSRRRGDTGLDSDPDPLDDIV